LIDADLLRRIHPTDNFPLQLPGLPSTNTWIVLSRSSNSLSALLLRRLGIDGGLNGPCWQKSLPCSDPYLLRDRTWHRALLKIDHVEKEVAIVVATVLPFLLVETKLSWRHARTAAMRPMGVPIVR